jgi:hypothetical protein
MVKIVVPVVVACTVLAAAQDLAETRTKLVGTWVLVEQRLEGKPSPYKEKTHSLTFKSDETFVYKSPGSTQRLKKRYSTKNGNAPSNVYPLKSNT